MLERRGKTRRYAAIFDEKGIPLPSATGVVIGGARSSMLVDEQEPILIHHTARRSPAGFVRLGARSRRQLAMRLPVIVNRKSGGRLARGIVCWARRNTQMYL
jgi:hypothetical protein